MSELIDVLLPADQVEGTRSQVQRWLKAVGQPARRHEPLVEIETDKVTVEVPSPADGPSRNMGTNSNGLSAASAGGGLGPSARPG